MAFQLRTMRAVLGSDWMLVPGQAPGGINRCEPDAGYALRGSNRVLGCSDSPSKFWQALGQYCGPCLMEGTQGSFFTVVLCELVAPEGSSPIVRNAPGLPFRWRSCK